MSTSRTLRQAAAVLLAEADRQEGKITNPQQMTTFAGRSVTVQEAWELLLAEIAERAKPHAWVDAGFGVPITEVGDNDNSPELDDLLRAFRPFCDALTREQQPDSTGALFYVPHIKNRGGLGLQSVRLIRDEIRGKWYSAWGEAWRAHPLNAQLLPKPEVVDALFSKEYG